MADCKNSKEQSDTGTQDANCSDPFTSHFNYEMSKNLASEFSEQDKKQIIEEWPSLGTLYIRRPAAKPENSTSDLIRKTKLSDFCVKENLMRSFETSDVFRCPENLSALQSEIFSIISTYRDFHFMAQTRTNCDALRSLYCLHALNHILRSRARIAHHDAKLAKNTDEEYRDQGFTRPTVLILAPFKESCLKIVNTMSSLLQNYAVVNKNRFQEEFGSDGQPPRKKRKPADYEATFSGNTEEDFKIGIKFKNKSMKLYANFYASDMIIASPVALRTIIGDKGDKTRDFDFLSSIEIFIVDQADVLMMQNWLNVVHLLDHLNLQPKEPHGCNFFRVRFYALDGLSKFYRQTLLFSATDHLYHRGLFSNHCYNHEGLVYSMEPVKVPSVCTVFTSMPQVFHRFESTEVVTDCDDRFKFFTSKILPELRKNHMAQTLIYIPAYYDYLRLRNYFRKNEISAAMLCEYTDPGKIAEGRNLFFRGHRDFMLYTERLHFYHRYNIKGVENIIFYQLPSYPSFYSEICNFVLDSNPARRMVAEFSCTVVFSKMDCRQLKHIVGFNRTCHMLHSERDVFVLRTK